MSTRTCTGMRASVCLEGRVHLPVHPSQVCAIVCVEGKVHPPAHLSQADLVEIIFFIVGVRLIVIHIDRHNFFLFLHTWVRV